MLFSAAACVHNSYPQVVIEKSTTKQRRKRFCFNWHTFSQTSEDWCPAGNDLISQKSEEVLEAASG